MNPTEQLNAILAQRARFRAFLVSRLGNEADADDVLQNGLLKAMASVATVDDEQRLTGWFYRVLQNALIDFARSRASRTRRDEAWTFDPTGRNDEAVKTICACFEGLLGHMKPRDAELVRRIELRDEPIAGVAASLGLSPGAASVALHRARAALRQHLKAFCGECAQGACLDCDCDESKQ